jgi:hypothetical protein
MPSARQKARIEVPHLAALLIIDFCHRRLKTPAKWPEYNSPDEIDICHLISFNSI